MNKEIISSTSEANSSNKETDNTSSANEILSRDQARDIGKIAFYQTNATVEQESTVPEVPHPIIEQDDGTRRRAEDFIRRHGSSLNLFSRDSSLNFVPSRTAETFSFNAKTFNIEVPLSWFANESYAEEELAFANYHERAHFIDMRKNPEAYIENFEQMGKDAKKLARNYCRTHQNESPEAVEEFYHKELHTLYNCLDDIYVNRLVSDRVPYFARGDGRKAVSTLYQKLGFQDPDFADKMPLHRQIPYALLRDAMLGEEYGASGIDDKVKAVLDTKAMGKSLRTLVDQDLSPKLGVLVDPKERYGKIRLFIQPKYLELLDVALQDAEAKKNQQGGGKGEPNDASDGSADNISGESAQGSANANSQFDPFSDVKNTAPNDILGTGDKNDVLRQILDKFKEDDTVKKMSPEERAAYQSQKRTEAFDNEHGITKEQRAENDRIKSEISGARKKMREFWKRLIGKSIEYRMTTQRHQRKGRLNVADYIRRYPEATEAARKGDLRSLEVYDRVGLERMLVEQPERIEATLLVDCSGSMSEERIEAAKKTAALMMYSLKDFNDEIESTREQTHTKLRANTQVIIFDNAFDEIKPFETNRKKEDADIIQSISKIENNGGGTDDATPMRWLDSKLTNKDKSDLKSKKLKKIVFEITDGEPNDADATRASVRKLSDEGVTMVGFQIYNIDEAKQEAFKNIWRGASGSTPSNSKGIYVGNDIKALPDKLMKELSDALKDIII